MPTVTMPKQLEPFGWHLLTNYVVRNADCHAKNAANPLALPIDSCQTRAVRKTLERLFKGRLSIAPKQYVEMVERLCESD